MCEHCVRDMSQYDWNHVPDGWDEDDMRRWHDGWLFPHGRSGYNSTPEDIARATAACPFCYPLSRLRVSYSGDLGQLGTQAGDPETPPASAV